MTRDERIVLRVTEIEKKEIQELSELTEDTVSNVIRKSVRQTLQELRREECLNGFNKGGNQKPSGYICR